MNRYDRVVEHLDGLNLKSLRLCVAAGSCACSGCVGLVNGMPVREHELIKYIQGKLVPNQFPRRDIYDRTQKQLSKHGDPADFVGQSDYVKNGAVWTNFLNRHGGPSVDIQVTGLFIHEWKEPLPGGEFMNWRMEEKENGDLDFTMSADIRFGVRPLPIGRPNAEPYIYIPAWPVDPNAPVIEEPDFWDEEV